MHIVRCGGTFGKNQERSYFIKASIFIFGGVILIFLPIFLAGHQVLVVRVISFGLGLLSCGYGLHYFKRSKNWAKGMIGEKKVIETLMPLDNSYVLINDVTLPYKKGNIDHILIGPNGIFAIETKSYKLTYLNRWGIKQAMRNAIALKEFVKEQTGSNMFIKAVLVSTDQNSFKNYRYSTVNVKSLNKLYSFIINDKNKFVLKDDVKKKMIHEILRCQSSKFNIDSFRGYSVDTHDKIDKKSQTAVFPA